MYEELSVHSLDRYFPRFMRGTWFLWFPLWQRVYILLIIPLSFIVAAALTRLIVLILRITRVPADQYVMTLRGPLHIFILALAMWTIAIVTRSLLVNLFWTYAGYDNDSFILGPQGRHCPSMKPSTILSVPLLSNIPGWQEGYYTKVYGHNRAKLM